MNHDRLQRQRFEFKFHVTPAQTTAIRDFVRCYLTSDEHNRAAGGHAAGYPVHSLYLDTEELQLYQSTINGDKNRYKLRIRYYDESPRSPAFFEIKRRMNNCIFKQRACVRREAVPALVAGAWPGLHHLVWPDVEQMQSLETFCRLRSSIGAGPRSHIAYDREAWVSTGDNAVRVTFDTNVRCEPQHDARLRTAFDRDVTVFPGEVILELKFADRFPCWMNEMVRSLDLVQGSAAKYVDGVAGFGEQHFCNGRIAMRAQLASMQHGWPAARRALVRAARPVDCDDGRVERTLP
jgi:hypothetical protein